MFKGLFLALDWRQEARDVRNLLRLRDIQSVSRVHHRLRQQTHNYPHSLLKLLHFEMPKMKSSNTNDEFNRLAGDLLRTAEWEIHERNRQLIM
jgi:hypothetical protein